MFSSKRLSLLARFCGLVCVAIGWHTLTQASGLWLAWCMGGYLFLSGVYLVVERSA